MESGRLFHQLMTATAYLHSLGISHRDIKPSNILMDFKDNVKIIDFGLGNTFISGKNLKTSCGSPCFAAPEIINGVSYNPEKVDMWSLGVTLYCMLCGRLPFDDDSKKELYKKIRSGKYHIPDYLSPVSRSLLQSLMNLSPEERPTAQALASHPFFQKNYPESTQPILMGIDEDAAFVAAHTVQLPYDAMRALLLNNDLGRQTTVYYLLKRKAERCKINLADERARIEKEKRTEQAKLKKQEDKYKRVLDESLIDKNKKGAMMAKIRGLTSRRGTENDRSRVDFSNDIKSKKLKLDEALFNNRTERPHVEKQPVLSLGPSRLGSSRMVRHNKTLTLQEPPTALMSHSLKNDQFERQSSTGSGKSYLLRRVTPKSGRGRLGESFNPSQSIEYQISNRLNISGGAENSKKKAVSLPKKQIIFENRRLGIESPSSHKPQERSSSISMVETFKIALKNKAPQQGGTDSRSQRAVLSRLIQAMGPRKINIVIGNQRDLPKDETVM